MKFVENGTCYYGLADGATARLATIGMHCQDLVMTGEPMNPGGGAFILPKGSPYSIKMTNTTLKLRRDGELDSLDDFFNKKSSCRVNGRTTLTFGTLSFFFYASFLACLVFLLEMIFDPQTPVQDEEAQERRISTLESTSIPFNDQWSQTYPSYFRSINQNRRSPI